MNSILLACLGAGCAAFSNLFFRKSVSSSQKENFGANGYLLCYYLFALISSFILFPRVFTISFHPTIFILGVSVGILNVSMMILTSKALQYGPAGFTFAFQNAGAVFPGILLFSIFGSDFGFSMTFVKVFGIILVLFGLFLGAKKETSQVSKSSSKWLMYALGCFAVQILCLTLIQGRCVLFECDKLGPAFSSLSMTESDDAWFMPGQFGAAFLLQLGIFLREKRFLQKNEYVYGFFGGLLNAVATCLLLFATKYALPIEKGILFPCFSVATIILCNAWANKLYKEDFNLAANALCAIGVFIGLLA